jgi:hypothetical protein
MEFINSIIIDDFDIDAGMECTMTRLNGPSEYAPTGKFTIVINGHKKEDE